MEICNLYFYKMVLFDSQCLCDTNTGSKILNIVSDLLHVLDLPYINRLASSVSLILVRQFRYHYVGQYSVRSTN